MYEFFNQKTIEKLNNSERAVFDYVTASGLEIIDMSIQDLADKTFVSKTTVVRMCKKLGFEGFTEFRYFYRDEYKNSKKKINLSEIQSLRQRDYENSLKMADQATVEKLVTMMKGKNLHFFGKGLSQLPCTYASIQFSLLGIKAISYDNTHLIRQIGKTLTREDLIFIVSASGELPQSISIANIVKNTPAVIVSVTNLGSNSLSRLADLALYVMSSDDERVDFDNKSRIPMFVLFQNILDTYIDQL